jgi:hypothetical protein
MLIVVERKRVWLRDEVERFTFREGGEVGEDLQRFTYK